MASHLMGLTSYLPPGDELLPKWLLFISIVSIGNSIGCYTSLAGSREVYNGDARQSLPPGVPPQTAAKGQTSPVNELSARTFGTWTAISSIVRLYAAYHIHERAVYELALWTFVIAWAHFVSEWLIFKTARWGRGLAGPACVATGTGLWMLLQRGHYLR